VPVLGVIPARLGSSRLPRKPLLSLAGEPLILWVVRRVAQAGVCDRVVVATDAAAIAAVVERAGYEAVLTSPQHRSGTERVAEVVARPSFSDFDLVLNVQGDEPLVALEAVQGAVARVRGGEPIGTAAAPLAAELARDPNRVKVIVDARGRAVYFSRAPIPFDRDGAAEGGGRGGGRGGGGGGGHAVYLQHVGVYAYTRDALEQWVRLPAVAAERCERLEQLRPLLHGIPIGVAVLREPAAPGVDTADDLDAVAARLARRPKEVGL
jgi:3-deoxy-manno-octulosonate cytidylyltransferase (CMP-KDO synthetase)